MATLESLEANVTNLQINHEKDKTLVWGELKEVKATLESKVSYQHFYWVIGILVTVQMAVLGYIIQQNRDISSKIEDTQKTAVTTQLDVSSLKGKLDPYNIQYQK